MPLKNMNDHKLNISNGIISSPKDHSKNYTNGYIVNDSVQCNTTKNDIFCNGQPNGKTDYVTSQEEFEKTPLIISILCYISYFILNCFGHLRDILRRVGIEKNRAGIEKNREGYVPLYRNYESFYTRNIYRRICNAWNQPIASNPGTIIDVIDRESDDFNWTFRYPGTTTRCINMGSYNYLGFAENEGPRIDEVKQAIKDCGIAIGSVRNELGTTLKHQELEKSLAQFLGVDDCVVFGMGFATNSTNIPALIGKGCLILSDELNHASLILGCRLSGATIKIFKHNNVKDLEEKLRKSIIEGQPRTHRPWKKIVIIIEGVYSMEGSIVNLKDIIKIKKKYGAYVYLDEAHSIGALGKTGRGVTEYACVDPKEIDILMGTFTKSFGAAGGYIAGSKKLIDHLRVNSHSFSYATSMSPVIAQQILTVLKTISTSEEGQTKIKRLARNSSYFRRKLKQMGFIVYGNDDSPVVPMLIFFPAKIVSFVKSAIKMGVATVGVGYPATPLVESRVRFCLSASHSKEMLDKTLQVTNLLGDKYALKYSRRPRTTQEIIY